MAETVLSRSPAYYDWLDRLYDLMNWHVSESGQTTWTCGDPETRDRLALAKQAAAELDMDFGNLMAQASELARIHCDCELIFNCDDRP